MKQSAFILNAVTWYWKLLYGGNHNKNPISFVALCDFLFIVQAGYKAKWQIRTEQQRAVKKQVIVIARSKATRRSLEELSPLYGIAAG